VVDENEKNELPSEAERSWLDTGGCGFIGTALIRSLLDRGKPRLIRVLDNLSVGTREDLRRVCEFDEVAVERLSDAGETPPKRSHAEDLEGGSKAGGNHVQLVVGDIRDAATCAKCCEGVDVVVHLAASTGVGPSVEDPRFDMESNVVGTLNMLEGARANGVKRFVFASSGAPVGEVDPPIHEELAPHPVSPYGASKLAGEGYCSAYFRSFGLETVALRFSNVYGPGSTHKASVVAKFIKQALDGETLEIYGDGTQTRDFVYIDDLVRAIRLAAAREGAAGEAFQIATARETTVGELTELLVEVLAEHGVEGVKVVHGEFRTGDVKRNFSDTRKAREVLGWEARMELRAGLEKAVRSFE